MATSGSIGASQANRLSDVPTKPLVEIGLITAGTLDRVDRNSVDLAVEQFDAFVRDRFPSFRWKVLQTRRPESVVEKRTAPSVLLQQAMEERDENRWDFAFVVTAAELESHYSNHCFAALSRPLDAAVFSLSLIDPLATGQSTNDDTRIKSVAHRLSRLMLHALGHLLGLGSHDSPANLLHHPAVASELDGMAELTPDQISRQRESLFEIADQRLEEQTSRNLSVFGFVVRSAWINRRSIAAAMIAAKPWNFPRRLSGLTLASLSTLAILLMTAETWDLAISQSATRLVGLFWASLIATIAYVIIRQRLLSRRRRRSEQSVVTSSAAIGIVLLGMAITWCCLFVIAITIANLFFNDGLIASWAAASSLDPANVDSHHRVKMATFTASIGLMIGALGASFESQNYFRHVIFVDEEI
jgi:hypothetical protein